MADLDKIWLFRMMHISNIPHVLQQGITHAFSPHANPSFMPIGDNSLISSRAQFPMPNGKKLGDCIPFYFGGRMPMLYVIQNGFNGVNAVPPEKIVYCITSVQEILNAKLPFSFTNGHAIDGLTTFYEEKDIDKIEEIIDKKAIQAKYWNDGIDLDLKRRKEAEFLVAGDIPAACIVGWIVYNNNAKSGLLQFGIADQQIVIKPDYYF